MEQVILVDSEDREIGTMEKIQAHQENRLHRAISVFVFNFRGEFLLQKRAANKYHCPGLWSNTACSHPRPGEETLAAGHRRLQEELGFDCGLGEKFVFTYNVKFSNGLWEYEVDHVLVGKYEGEVRPNPEEAEECEWISLRELLTQVKQTPEVYTPWFKIILTDCLDELVS